MICASIMAALRGGLLLAFVKINDSRKNLNKPVQIFSIRRDLPFNHSTPLNWGIFFAPMKKNG